MYIYFVKINTIIKMYILKGAMENGQNNKQNKIDEKVEELNKDLTKIKVSSSLEENAALIKGLFKDDDTIIVRNVVNENDREMRFCAVYCEALANSAVINESIIKPLILTHASPSQSSYADVICESVLQTGEVKKTDSFKDIVEAVAYGDTVLFMEGSDKAVYLDTKSFTLRQPAEPPTENVLSGPREGFTEGLMNNISYLHRRLRTNDLKFKIIKIGERSKTDCCVCYIESLVNKQILDELFSRLNKIKIDAVIDANYLSELLRDNKASPFKTIGKTERPDSVTGKILEGRIAVLVDGTPVVLTLPYLFIENFQSPEDYYINYYYYSSFSRLLRIIGFFITITVPAFYIAVVAYHHEMLPTALLSSITIDRRNVPFPAAVEAFLLLTMFEIIRETGIRMPSNIGQALSIVGALVIGQAAVEAKLIAAPMIIIVSITAITGLLIPKLFGPAIIIRYMLLLLSSLLGLFGFIIGISFFLIHILGLKSFGVSQMSQIGDLKLQDVKDTFIRSPWQFMDKRTEKIAKNLKRLEIKEG